MVNERGPGTEPDDESIEEFALALWRSFHGSVLAPWPAGSAEALSGGAGGDSRSPADRTPTDSTPADSAPADSAVDDSDGVVILDRPVGATRPPRPTAPSSKPWRDPWIEAEESLTRELEEVEIEFDESIDRFRELLDEFDQSRAAGADAPAGWRHLWWWARLYDVEQLVDRHLEERGRTLWVTPSDDTSTPAGAEGASKLDRLHAATLIGERLAVSGAAGQREYGAIRELAVDAQPDVTLDDIQRWLADHGPDFDLHLDEDAPASDGGAAPAADAPVAVPPATGGRDLKSVDPHALEPEIDGGTPEEADSGVDDADNTAEEPRDRPEDDDGRGVVQVAPVKLELDPDPREGLDSAVDDADSAAPIVESAVGAEPFPAPGTPRHAWTETEATPSGDATGQPAGTGSAGSTSAGRGGRGVAIGVAVVAAAITAVVAGIALLGGDDSPEVVGAQPTAAASQPAGDTTVSPEPTATELPAFELTEPPTLVICNDGSSFSGIEQPDGTFTDPDTGELLSCS